MLPDSLDASAKTMLKIDYMGDCARLYAGDTLVADNFYYGRPMLFGLWRLDYLGIKTDHLQLRILPLQKNMPVYGCGDGVGHKVQKISLVQ